MDFTETEELSLQEDAVDEADTPLAHRAAANGETETVTRAIKADPTVLEHPDGEGLTPLGHAVLAEQLDSVKLLVKLGASINTRDNTGRTALAMAAYQGWFDGVVFLLRNGARQSIKDKSGRTPLHCSTYDTDTRVLGALLQSLGSGDVNLQDNEGMTALHWAAFHSRPEHLKLLLSHQGELLAQDIDGKSALHWAAQNGCVVCCRLLLDADRDLELINLTDFSGKTPLHFAAAAGHADVIRELTKIRECDIEAEDPDERTPLHWAAATGQANAVSSLLELNANPGPVDMEGGTPLDYARQSQHPECVQILEQRLGIQTQESDSQLQNNVQQGNQNQDTGRGKKNPLGFIVDLFRPKKAKANPPEISVESPAVLNESSSSAQSQDFSPEEGPSGNANKHFLQRNISSSSDENVSHRGSDVRLSTPKRQREVEVIRSMEKLSVSREDNPALQRKGQGHASLGEIRQSHSQNLPLRDNTKAVLPPMTVVHDTENHIDHSHLIRSPPPSIRHEGSLSPVRSLLTAQVERSSSQLEEDAAQILALHHRDSSRHSFSGAVSSLPSPRPLSPINKNKALDLPPPGTRHSKSYSLDSVPFPLDRDYSGLESPLPRRQLAPLKGPIPDVSSAASGALEWVTQEGHYVPKPSMFKQCSFSSSGEYSSRDSSPTPRQTRQKKKKKKVQLHVVELASDISGGHGIQDPGSLQSLVPDTRQRLPASSLTSQQRVLDKEISGLLD